jgi:hypothetical protein
MGNSFPKLGIDAYDFKDTRENLIGTGGFSNVFSATRKHDNHNIAIKRSLQRYDLLSNDA